MVKQKVFSIRFFNGVGYTVVFCASNYKTAKKLVKLCKLQYPSLHWCIDVHLLYNKMDNNFLDFMIKKYEK